MASLTIKDVSTSLHEELKKAARSQGKSLNSFILSLLEMSVDERERRRMMRESREEFHKFLATLPRMEDSTPLIREDRDQDHR